MMLLTARMRTLLLLLREPEVLLRPQKLCSYYLRKMCNRLPDFEEIVLPWGCRIRVKPNEYIGKRLVICNLFDLCISELIWRLLTPGQCAVDVGANIGYMTSIMASRVGKHGRVIAFEPHPGLFQELLANVRTWQTEAKLFGKVVPYNIALSNVCGEGVLKIPSDFEGNRGLCSLVSDVVENDDSTYLKVQVERLDEILRCEKQIELLKIDVEGHELEVLKGSSYLIENGRIANIIFEDPQTYPTPATMFLEQHGYALLYLGKKFLGLTVGNIEKNREKYRRSPEGASYLATREPERILSVLGKKGWTIMR